MKPLVLAVPTVLLVIAGYFILGMDMRAGATGDTLIRVGKSFVYGMGALAVVFLVLHFVPQAFNAWKKFAVWFIPLAVLFFIFYPEPGSGDYFSPYPETVFRVISAMYVLICLAIVGWSVRK